jgi:hypothetical protein
MARGRHRRPRRYPWSSMANGRRGTVIALGVVGTLVGGGTAAYAYWSATGTGAGTIQSTTAATLTVSAAATPLADLFPGKTDDLSFRITNTNAYPVSLTKLTALTIGSSDPANCPSSNITVNVTIGAGGYTLPTPISVLANATASPTMTGLITLAAGAPDGCQGRTFTANMTFTGSQV